MTVADGTHEAAMIAGIRRHGGVAPMTSAADGTRRERIGDAAWHVRPWLVTMLTRSPCPGITGPVCGLRTRIGDTLCQPCFDQAYGDE
jgi:hypothetical protein